MTVLVVLVRRHCCAVGAAVRRAVDDEVPSAVEEKTGPAAVRRMPPGLLDNRAVPKSRAQSISVLAMEGVVPKAIGDGSSVGIY